MTHVYTTALASLILLTVLTSIAHAQAPSGCSGVLTEARMVECLAPINMPETRSLFGRNVAKDGTDKVDASGTVDLQVNFAFDSAVLTNDARITLGQLARALANPRLADKRFKIAGHTDAKGTAEYNLTLSEARAVAVQQFLSGTGIPASLLETQGFGFSKLAYPEKPEDGLNRRVEITTIR